MTNDQVNSGTEHSGGEGVESLVSREHGSLVGRELDAAVAEGVMGLVPCQSDQHAEGAKFYIERPCHAQPDSPNKGGETLCYSTEIAAAMSVEDRIDELGLAAIYARLLAESTPHWLHASDEATWWHCAHATAEQRCRAALQAVALKTPEAGRGEHGPTQ